MNLHERVQRFNLGSAYSLMSLTQNFTPGLAGRLASYIWFRPIRKTTKGRWHRRAHIIRRVSTPRHPNILVSKWFSENPDANTVLLVHGWAGSSEQFRELIPVLLASGRDVVTVDFPGHGRSCGLSTDLMEMVDILEKVVAGSVDAHRSLDMVCHSLGLMAAAKAITDADIKVRKLVSVSSPHRFGFLWDQFVGRIRLNERAQTSLMAGIQKRVGHRGDVRTEIDLKPGFHPEENWLLIHDRKDRDVPFSEFEMLREKFPSAMVFATEGYGHNRILHAEDVHERILQFLDKA